MLPPPTVADLFRRVPEGWSVMTFAGRRYGVTRTRHAGGLSAKLYAEELGGTDVVSANLYGENGFRPCEMPAAKVLAFLAGATRADTGGTDHPRETSVPLPPELLDLLRRASPCYLATLMPDGSPQMTQTWVDTDGTNVVINTVVGFQKDRNVARDPRVALNVSDPDNPSRYFEVRGRVTHRTTEGGTEHIEALAQRYLGGPYPWYGGRDQQRLILTISAETVHGTG